MSQQNELEKLKKDLSEMDKENAAEAINNLSPEQVDLLFEALSSEKSESSEKLSKLPSNTTNVLEIPSKEYLDSISESKERLDGVPIKATMNIDPITGLSSISTDPDSIPVADRSISELVDMDNPDTEKLKDTLTAAVGPDLSDVDILEILSFLKKVEDEKPKKLYNLLPRSIKKAIDDAFKYETHKDAKEFAAREFYNMIYSEIKVDKEFMELDEMIKKEMEIPDITDMYLDYIREVMEDKLLEKANVVEKESVEKAEILRRMSASFTDSYTYTTLRNKIMNKRGIINKQLTKELKNYDSYCNKINAMYKHSNFIITDVRTLLYILDRKLPDDIHINSIKKFIILLFQICRNKDISKLEDHTYIYYSTKLIQSLDHIDSPKTDMSITILKNIIEIINLIEEE